MVQVAFVDYPARRIFLHPDTITEGFNSIEAYREVRAARRVNENGERNYLPILAAQGNEPTGGGRFTPRRAVLAPGARFVPVDQAHTLRLLTESIIPSEELSQQGVFDRSAVGSAVDIDNQAPQVEIIAVAVGSGVGTGGGGLTEEERRWLQLARDHARAANVQTKPV